jgi:hypothetical protein
VSQYKRTIDLLQTCDAAMSGAVSSKPAKKDIDPDHWRRVRADQRLVASDREIFDGRSARRKTQPILSVNTLYHS